MVTILPPCSVRPNLQWANTTRTQLFLRLGQISASLAAMHRTIDDYDSMAKREMIKAKQEKAQMRVQKFRADYAEFRNQFERLKTQVGAEVIMPHFA